MIAIVASINTALEASGDSVMTKKPIRAAIIDTSDVFGIIFSVFNTDSDSDSGDCEILFSVTIRCDEDEMSVVAVSFVVVVVVAIAMAVAE
mmetsp:Transcript_17020/g.17063  ORF Transcript_17020/g.17063 Transcript_17020/m.17063 type:complete len:91 (-) Transcript_17020:201-473(-)